MLLIIVEFSKCLPLFHIDANICESSTTIWQNIYANGIVAHFIWMFAFAFSQVEFYHSSDEISKCTNPTQKKQQQQQAKFYIRKHVLKSTLTNIATIMRAYVELC